MGLYIILQGMLDALKNDIKAEIENKGDHLEVTVTQSNYEDIIGTKQEFFQADE